MESPSVLPLFLLLSLLLAGLSTSKAEIKTLKFKSDPRPMILFEKFGFARGGMVSITVSDVTYASTLSVTDPSLLGFFLLSEKELIQDLYESQQQQKNPNANDDNNRNLCVLSSPYVNTLFTFRDLRPPPYNSYNNSFPVIRPDEYSLFFANCASETVVSMSVHTEMFNTRPDGSRDYLSVGQDPVPSLYSFFALAYIAFLGIWLYLCFHRNRLSAHRIHYLMSGLLLTKALNLIAAAEDQHYIRSTGTPHGWDILFYLFQFLKGVLLFTVIVLIGTGWSFLKPFLQEREKKILMIVIPLQIITNVASIVIGENGPFIKDLFTWNQVFLLIDIACCCAILFPIIWSMRSLREVSKTDGKAARNLAKLTLFRQFYIIVVGYLYFTRIIVFALKNIASYKSQWVSVLAEEAVSLTFYVFMFNMFRPMERNDYFVLDEEEEEAAQVALQEQEFEL